MHEIETCDAPASIGPFSQGIIEDSTIYVSGQGPVDPNTDSIIEGSPSEQTRRVLKNIDSILQAADASLDNIVKTTIYLKDMRYYDEVNEAYGELFSEPYPARSAVEVGKLPIDIDVEIEAIAMVSNPSD